jgi:hypothetical protein
MQHAATRRWFSCAHKRPSRQAVKGCDRVAEKRCLVSPYLWSASCGPTCFAVGLSTNSLQVPGGAARPFADPPPTLHTAGTCCKWRGCFRATYTCLLVLLCVTANGPIFLFI